ncbi:unnamed protein product [Effrenium voratum]|nr:unnamed protein product [Effrenium voratum]
MHQNETRFGLRSEGLMVLVWLARSARGTLHGTVPFGRTITTLGAAVLSFVPAARNLLFTWTLRWLPAAHWQAWLELRDPFLGLPIGWLFFLFLVFSCLVLVHLGAKLGVRYFASLPEPEGEVDFLIGSDGRRVDLLPSTPIAQRVLGWAIWSLGVALLLCSTHSDICSLLITAGILLKDHLGHWLNTWQLWKQAELQPQDLHPLISEDQMRAQAAANTQQALAQLQQYLRENPLTVQSVREDSELRLRRFREDGAHFRQPLVPATEDRASCVLS